MNNFDSNLIDMVEKKRQRLHFSKLKAARQINISISTYLRLLNKSNYQIIRKTRNKMLKWWKSDIK